jgi:hypothetical protein
MAEPCFTSPDKNTFLTAEQTKLVQDRIELDRGDSEFDRLTWKKFCKYSRDLKLWGFGLCFMATLSTTYGLQFFTPVILRGMGYNKRDSQLLVSTYGVY